MHHTMTRIICFLLLVGLSTSCRKKLSPETIAANATIETQPYTLEPHVRKVGPMIGGYYSGTPALYPKTSKNYPLLISVHGGGQVGNGNQDLPFVLNDGIPSLLAQKKFPPSFHVGTEDLSFVVLAPQFNQYASNQELAAFIDFARKEYRIDPSRIYVTGLSMGGIVTSEMGGEYTSRIAAIVPMSGVSIDDRTDLRCKNIANGKMPVWIFHNDDDPKISATEPKTFIATINKYNPAIPPRLTLFHASSHDSWTAAMDPAYKENGMNIYEWMLQYRR
ncbi:MAG: dienelactone hydrolase family protein [Chitinophagaceae bacterium]